MRVESRSPARPGADWSARANPAREIGFDTHALVTSGARCAGFARAVESRVRGPARAQPGPVREFWWSSRSSLRWRGSV
eukprot:scaffold52052_cov45-Phaeocystis_antarctica.AAC.2